MKKELKTTYSILHFSQIVFMVCAIASGIYGWQNGDFKIYVITGVLIYISMFFYGLKIHLGKLISKDFENETKKTLKIWSGMNRYNRRKQEKAIKKELLKK